MPYQNNNNRIVPQAVQGLTAITPQAQITDQLIRPQIGLGLQAQASNRQHLANALAEIGKGIYNINNAMKQSVSEAAIQHALNEQDIEGKEREKWAEAVKRFPLAARFNPYYKQAYNSRIAGDIAEKAVIDLSKPAELHKYSREEFNKFVLENRKQMTAQMKELGLNSYDVEKALINYQSAVDRLNADYTAKNAAYTLDLSMQKAARTAGEYLQNAVYNDSLDTYTAVSDILNTGASEFKGLAKDTLVQKYIIPAVLNTVKYGDYEFGRDVDISAVIRAAGDFKFDDGTDLKTYHPQIDAELRSAVRDIFRQQAYDKQLENQAQALAEKEAYKKASKKLFSQEYNSLEEMAEQAKVISNEMGMPEMYSSLVQEIAGYNRNLKSLEETKESEPEFIYELYNRYSNGELTRDFIWANRNKLSGKDTVNWLNQITRDEINLKNKKSEEKKQAEASWRVFHKNALDWGKQYKTDLENLDKSRGGMYINGRMSYERNIGLINQKYKDGIFTYEQAVTASEELQRAYETEVMEAKMNAEQGERKPVMKDARQLRMKAYRGSLTPLNDDVMQKGTDNAISEVFTEWGISGNSAKIGISRGMRSSVTEHPSLKGVKERHQAYDIMLAGGQGVYMPKASGGVVADMWEHPSTGLVMTVRMENGSYMMLMHLNRAFASKLKIGSPLKAGQQFAVSGYRGKDYASNIVTGEHIDIQFFNADGNKRLTARQFYAGLNSKEEVKTASSAADNRDKR